MRGLSCTTSPRRVSVPAFPFSLASVRQTNTTYPVMFHSTRPTADLWSSKSPTMLALHFSLSRSFSGPPPSPTSSPSRSSLGVGGFTRHIRTWPSREPVATRWYDRPHDGAHATDVIANALGGSPSVPDADVDVAVVVVVVLVTSEAAVVRGEGLRLSTVVGRWEGDIWMIFNGTGAGWRGGHELGGGVGGAGGRKEGKKGSP